MSLLLVKQTGPHGKEAKGGPDLYPVKTQGPQTYSLKQVEAQPACACSRFSILPWARTQPLTP